MLRALEKCSILVSSCATGLFLLAFNSPATGENKPNRVTIEYVVPSEPSHLSIYDALKSRQALEKLQKIFSPFVLPAELTLRTTGCGGVPNAWYQGAQVTVCYEYLERIWRTMPKTTTAAGIAPEDAVVGQLFYVFAHETGHALFDLLAVPVFGHPEDAADQFATYIMLQFGKDEAYRLITGAAYAYRNYINDQTVTVPLIAFADAHSAPAQRYYNLLCLAYGAHPELFALVVEKKYLPSSRAAECKKEYGEVAYAFHKLIKPHIDQDMASRVMQSSWLPTPLSGPKAN